MDKEIFTLIKEEKEKLKLWKDLGSAKGEILCKGLDDALCNLRVSFFNTKVNALEAIFESPNKMKLNEEFLAYFFLGGEKYYFQGKAQVHGDSLLLPLPEELYQLQRRQNYRVRIPEVYPAFYNITSINSAPHTVNGHLGDLSSQGCRVVYRLDVPVMKIGDAVIGNLIISKRAAIEIKGVVRHIKLDEGGKGVQTFGIEFTPLPAILENKLFAITMEIHKELFKRPT